MKFFAQKFAAALAVSGLSMLPVFCTDAAPAANPTTAQIINTAPPPISGNPGAVNVSPGNGFIQSLTPLKPDTGITFGGVWLGDYNILMAGGEQPGASSYNSLLIISANIDAEKLIGWKGADFGVQFLQANLQNTNGQAGSVQGYNSLPGPSPLTRSELYQAWYRQRFFDDHLIVRIGRTVPTFDFNNVTRPASTTDNSLQIPSVSGLLYTPVFVNPTLLGALPGYYNSADGLTVTLAPTKNTYVNYGFYNGNVARGVQTGMVAPYFNGYYFHIVEAGGNWVLADKYPGAFGVGAWYQTGLLKGQGDASQDGTGGFYFFGSQRIWGHEGIPASTTTSSDGKKTITIPATGHNSSISMFYQYGINNSQTLPVNQYFGGGLTTFGLVPGRPDDSVGAGLGWSWLNPKLFNRPSELMFQAYYQAHIYGGLFVEPAFTYIPTPGDSASLNGAWAMTLRLTLLF